MRTRTVALLVSLWITAGLSAQVGTFRVMSFNTLHFGWGGMGNTVAKSTEIFNISTNSNAHAIALQEVMAQALVGPLATLQGYFPGAAHFAVAANGYGGGAYVEFYVIILDTGMFVVGAQHEFPALSPGTFSRPPMAVAVQPNGSANTYYIADFHAIWGRVAAQRAAEATSICTVWQAGVGGGANGIAFVGDWNLTAAQVTANGACMSAAQPTGLTTLNRAGTAYSSSYDHGVQFGAGGGLMLTASSIYNPPNTAIWRATVSDHVPVLVDYSYQ